MDICIDSIIKNAFLTGFRLKFEINNHIGISLGFKRLSREHKREVSSAWTFPYDYGEYQYRIVYSSYTLSIKKIKMASHPLFARNSGVHWNITGMEKANQTYSSICIITLAKNKSRDT